MSEVIALPESQPLAAAPVTREERVNALDVVRGFALLGILLMNIVSFGMPMAAEGNPTVWGGAEGVNYWFWWVQAVFWSGKMRALFSLCFGAGVIYLTARSEAKGLHAGDIHYRRTFWLMLFGLIHGHLIWYGDILYAYALLALILYPLRKFSARVLMSLGVGMVGLLSLLMWLDACEKRENYEKIRNLPPHARVAKELEEPLRSHEAFAHELQPTAEEIGNELKAYRGSYFGEFAHRTRVVMQWSSFPYYHPSLWDMLSFMLIGMAVAKMGVLSGRLSTRACVLISAVCLAAGSAFGIRAVNLEASNHFAPLDVIDAYIPYQPVRLLFTFGYLAVILAIVQTGALQWLTGALGAVGRMAFTNYIMHSLICTTFFYGHGFGWFGTLERHQLYYVVAAIWAFQLVASSLWLRHFRFGPLEWCWRSLTYWKRQPMRLAVPTSVQSLPAENPA